MNRYEKQGIDSLSADSMEVLLEGLAPMQPDAALALRLRERIMRGVQAVAADPLDYMTIRAEDGEWQAITRKVSIKVLREDASTRSVLMRILPGGAMPAHAHDMDEESLVMEGECMLGDIYLKLGDYHLAPRGLSHGSVRSKTGCLLFIRGARPDASPIHAP